MLRHLPVWVVFWNDLLEHFYNSLSIVTIDLGEEILDINFQCTPLYRAAIDLRYLWVKGAFEALLFGYQFL